MSFLPAVKIWLWLSVFASVAGWTLSAFGLLNIVGYSVIAGVALFVLIQASAQGAFGFRGSPWRWGKLKTRFGRGYPLIFAILALMVLVGGILYPPSNHTGLSYRIPRVLHWLSAQEWHWIYTPNIRMNTRACGIEWLSVPFLLFLKSDRGLFLLNFIPFLLLPGLIYSMFTRLGVRRRVAWQWMWLLPTGYVFLLQAGSAGNDAYPAVYALAAVDFACRAWKSRQAADLWHSLLAIALLNGAKASNLTLTLMWVVLATPLWKIFLAKPLSTVRVSVLALMVSFVPTALLNIYYCKSWSGLAYEKPGMDLHNPVVGLFANPFWLAVNNFCPPVFPIARWWNQHILQLLPGPIVQPMLRNLEEGFWFLWELPTEDWTGIGAGISLLALIATIWALRGWRQRKTTPGPTLSIPPKILFWALVSPWIALLVFCVKSGMVTPARLITPYYPLLLPLFLVGGEQVTLVRQRWWRWLAGAVFAMAFVVLIVTPPRPLWPAKTILTKMVAAYPENKLLARALKTYEVYSIRHDTLAPLRALLPPDLHVVGFLGTHDDLDISLWRPFGTRRVEQIGHIESPENVRARGIKYAVVSGYHFQLARTTIEEWSTLMRAEVLADVPITVTVSSGENHWYLVRFTD